ncbi:MAG: hypothetical protein ACYTDT_00865 [Planctomycetota bacterium]|jgi:hypothetical protein
MNLKAQFVCRCLLLAVMVMVGGTLTAATQGSQAANITFSDFWGTTSPASPSPDPGQLDDYWNKNYVTLVWLWSPG